MSINKRRTNSNNVIDESFNRFKTDLIDQLSKRNLKFETEDWMIPLIEKFQIELKDSLSRSCGKNSTDPVFDWIHGKGENEVVIEKKVKPHRRHDGMFIVTNDQIYDHLCTLNSNDGEIFAGELLFKINGKEYRVWNPFKSKLAAAIIGGLEDIGIGRGKTCLYLCEPSEDSLISASHISDVIGPEGKLYIVANSNNDKNLTKLEKKRKNVEVIFSNPSNPNEYKKLIRKDEVEVLVCSLPKCPDASRVMSTNSECFLQVGGFFIEIVNGDMVTNSKPEIIFAKEVENLRNFGFRPREQITLDPFERNQAVIVGSK